MKPTNRDFHYKSGQEIDCQYYVLKAISPRLVADVLKFYVRTYFLKRVLWRLFGVGDFYAFPVYRQAHWIL